MLFLNTFNGFYLQFWILWSFPQSFVFNFWGQKLKCQKSDNHLVELVILRLWCVLFPPPVNIAG